MKKDYGDSKRLCYVLLQASLHFFPPTVKYIINQFETLSLEETAYAGYKLGYYGIGILVLIDPVVDIKYYFNKFFKINNTGGSRINIIIVGWYIVG